MQLTISPLRLRISHFILIIRVQMTSKLAMVNSYQSLIPVLPFINPTTLFFAFIIFCVFLRLVTIFYLFLLLQILIMSLLNFSLLILKLRISPRRLCCLQDRMTMVFTLYFLILFMIVLHQKLLFTIHSLLGMPDWAIPLFL